MLASETANHQDTEDSKLRQPTSTLGTSPPPPPPPPPPHTHTHTQNDSWNRKCDLINTTQLCTTSQIIFSSIASPHEVHNMVEAFVNMYLNIPMIPICCQIEQAAWAIDGLRFWQQVKGILKKYNV